MNIYAVEYQYDTSLSAEMDEVRPKHRAHLRSLHESGKVVAVGSWPTPGPGAFIFVKADSNQEALNILAEDPFLLNGFISVRHAHPFNLVIGELTPESV